MQDSFEFPYPCLTSSKSKANPNEGAARAEPSLLELCRVATEEDKVKRRSNERRSQACLDYPESRPSKAKPNEGCKPTSKGEGKNHYSPRCKASGITTALGQSAESPHPVHFGLLAVQTYLP